MPRDFWIGLGLLGFSLVCLLYLVPTQVGAYDSSAALLPLIALVVLAALSALLSLQGLRARPDGGSRPAAAAGSSSRAMVLVGMVAVMAGYAWLLEWLGFLPTSLVALVCLLLLSGIRQPVRIGVISLALVTALYLLFDIVLKAPLPPGMLVEQFLH